ncbi:MAG TPA: PfkB family carbohydrate kinase [Ilumatobacter sp.]|nr:PfkB family carbohydrate kinase [Ilumatobacter sp.]
MPWILSVGVGVGVVLTVGEALVDIVHGTDATVTEHPGGSVANVAVALARLGMPVRLATWIGADERGETVAGWLAGAGVELVPGSTAAARTPTATATLDESGAATYEFDIEWQVAGVLPAHADAVAVHTGSLAALLDPGATELLAFVRTQRSLAVTSYDPNIRPALAGDRHQARRRVEAFVAAADIVKASADDVTWLYPGVEPEDVARQWLAAGPAMVVVTRGAHGVFAVCAAGELNREPPTEPTRVVDTVGAGDAFTGALLWGLAEAGLLRPDARPALYAIDVTALARLVEFASCAAELSVGRAGADPPTLAELHAVVSPGDIARVRGGD